MSVDVPSSEAERVLIQKLDSNTMKNYNELRSNKKLKEATVSALRSTKVSPASLAEILKDYKGTCESEKIQNQIQKVINEINSMYEGGSARMFICHDCEKDGSKLEYICLVVYKYKVDIGDSCGKCRTCKACINVDACGLCAYCNACENPITCKSCSACKSNKKCTASLSCGDCRACKRCKFKTNCGRCENCRKCESTVAFNYLLTSYSYKEKVNKYGVIGGGLTIIAGIVAGAIMIPLDICTGGIGFLLAGGVSSAITACGVGACGATMIIKSTDTHIEKNMRDFLLACFVYELGQLGYVEVENEEVFYLLKDTK